ncbi:hypothetical protein [Delftia acidovorans]|uniref:hypothetical protein n=1 Tax=Delftia acidovorans TaxID=80866 RepID=UPI00301771F8
MTQGRGRLATGLLLSLLMHGVLLWQGLAPDIQRPDTARPGVPRLQLVWVETPAPTPEPAPVRASHAPYPLPAAARPEPASAPRPVRQPQGAAVAPPSRPIPAATDARAATTEPPASAAPAPAPADNAAIPGTERSARAMGRLLDSAAGRQAVQAAARQGQAALQTPVQREDPLASAMREAAHGDCMKGEFKGGGMGLLSLPMLAAAALKGECSR